MNCGGGAMQFEGDGSRVAGLRLNPHPRRSRCKDFQYFHIVWRSRTAAGHVGRDQHCFRVAGGIVVYDDGCSWRVLRYPVFEWPNLIGRVLPNFAGRNMARIDARRILLSAYRVAQAAKDVVLFSPAAAGLFQSASFHARRYLRPSSLGVLCPSCCCRYYQREDRAQAGKEDQHHQYQPHPVRFWWRFCGHFWSYEDCT
jgi:hypothetical protein